MLDHIDPGSNSSLTDCLRTHTAALHRQAERSGIVAQLLAGTLTRAQHALYLRNLLPAYAALEQALGRHRDNPLLGPLGNDALWRADTIIADLEHLAGADWVRLGIVAAADRYAARIAAVGDDTRLIAHAYTRYLGDLNGGRFLHSRLVRLFGASCFTEFPGIADPAGFTLTYRAALDRACPTAAMEAVLHEAVQAFELNIALSEEVAALMPS